MIQPTVDLRSDTVTQPTPDMRRVMMDAEVGDHVLGDDPTANELEQRCAELLGKDWSLFMPSGTMANQVAVLIGSRPGTEVVVDHRAHLVHYEDGGAAAWSGVQLRPVPSDGVLDVEATAEAIRDSNRFVPETSLLCIENTHNAAGGRIMSVDRMAELAAVARERGVAVHLDGARLPNAAVATGRSMLEWTRNADTVMMSLSKGLGAPIGSVLAGPAHLLERAWRARRRLGGGMRQAGILAAAALFALDHNFDRLAEDHHRAKTLALALDGLPGLAAAAPETNIVMIDVSGSPAETEALIGSLNQSGVLVSRFGPTRLRAVTHLGIDDANLERAIEGFRAVTAPV
jgi:threonine aldolase